MEGSSTTAVTDVVGSPFPSPSLSELYNTVTCEGVVGDTVLRNCKVRKEGRSLLLNFRRCYRTFPSHIPFCTVYNRRHMKSAHSHSHPYTLLYAPTPTQAQAQKRTLLLSSSNILSCSSSAPTWNTNTTRVLLAVLEKVQLCTLTPLHIPSVLHVRLMWDPLFRVGCSIPQLTRASMPSGVLCHKNPPLKSVAQQPRQGSWITHTQIYKKCTVCKWGLVGMSGWCDRSWINNWVIDNKLSNTPLQYCNKKIFP